MPVRLIGDQGAGRRIGVADPGKRLLAHVGFDLAALAVHGIQFLCELGSLVFIVGQQTFDAERDVGQSPGGVDAWPDRKAQILARCGSRLPSGQPQQCKQPRAGATGAQALQAGRHQQPIVAIEAHHIRDRAERDQVEKFAQVGFGAPLPGAALAQHGAGGEQDIEHHADAGQMLAGEWAAVLVGIDQHRGIGQDRARQVMIGDQHLHPGRAGVGHAVQAGHAVVDGDQQIGASNSGMLERQVDDLGCQAIAVFEAVGHQIVDDRAHRPQSQYPNRHAGGAVTVVIADNQQAAACGDRIGEQRAGVDCAKHQRRCEQIGRAAADAPRRGDAAPGIQTGHQRRDSCRSQAGQCDRVEPARGKARRLAHRAAPPLSSASGAGRCCQKRQKRHGRLAPITSSRHRPSPASTSVAPRCHGAWARDIGTK